MRTFSGIFFVLCLAYGLISRAQGVNIGSNTPPDPNATLEVSGTNGGLLLPRLTTSQRNALQNPPEGLQIYNTTNKCVEVWFPSGWKPTGCDCNSAPPMPNQIQGPALVCPADTLVSFSVPQVQGAVQYQWVIDNQDTLVSSNGGDTISVNFSNQQGNRTISVTASNSCGVSSASTFQVQVANPVATFTVNPSSPNINNAAQFNATTANATFAWTFQNGTPASSVSQNPQVTWSQIGQVQVRLIATSPAGCVDTLDSLLNVINCQPATFSFNNCGQTGHTGPSQSQCNSTYGTGVVSVSNGIQTWVVPTSGTYRIRAEGARGGVPNGVSQGNRGPGAIIEANVTLNAGDQIRMVVGQEANQNTSGNTANGGGRGGGGTFVWISGQSQPLVVAGGGGGGSITNTSGSSVFLPGKGGNTSTSGLPAYNNDPVFGTNGGDAQSGWGGKGWNSMSGSGNFNGITASYGSIGGFGGGGNNRDGDHAGGGAGGYSGGGGGNYNSNTGTGNSDGRNGGGGGGSYVVSTASNVATSNGQYNNSSSFNGSPVQNLNSYNAGQGSITITQVCP
jgi:hypothetical protein